MRGGSRPLRGPVLVTGVLAVVLLAEAVLSPVPAYAVGSGAFGVAAALSAAGMATRDPFEARLTALVVSTVSGILAVVVMLLGTPGSRDGGAGPVPALVLACAVLLPVLLARAPRTRPRPHGLTSTYPSEP